MSVLYSDFNISRTSGIIILVFLILGIFFLSKSLGRRGSWLEIVRLNERKKQVKQEIIYLKKQNSILRENVRRIKQDPLYIEKIAREEIGMLKKGEIVYCFVGNK